MPIRKPAILFVAMLAAGAQAPAFEPVQPELFGAGGTFTNAWADYDGDGDPDLFVGFNGTPNRLYRNEGGVFSDVAAAVGVADARPTRAAAWGDFDGDGDPDLLVGFATPGPVLRLYRNEGGRFTDVTAEVRLSADSGAVRQLSWIDVDGDADLDVFVAFRDRPNALFRNDVDGFRDVATLIGLADPRRSVGALWLDSDADGDLDLLVGNMDGDANGLFRNDAGRFTDVAARSGIAWGGRIPGEATNGTVRPCAADVDGDGRIDLFFANYGRNGLFLARDSLYEDVSEAWGIAADSRDDTCAFGDFDNDGRVDLFVNGTVTGGVSYPDRFYLNAGGHFEEVTPPGWARFDSDHGAAWADFDGDGDLDLSLTAAPPTVGHALLRNGLASAQAGRSLHVMLLDDQGRALPGSELRLYDSASGRLLGVRLVDSGSGYNSQGVLPVHFGGVTSDRIDLQVVVPGTPPARIGRIDPGSGAGRSLVVRLDRAGGLGVER